MLEQYSNVTYEEFFVLGMTGVGSARADLRPAVAGAIACSTNEVKAHQPGAGREAADVRSTW